jgi:hypothetical protein
VASLAKRILIGDIEISTLLPLLIHLRSYLLSLIDEFWGEDTLIV